MLFDLSELSAPAGGSRADRGYCCLRFIPGHVAGLLPGADCVFRGAHGEPVLQHVAEQDAAGLSVIGHGE